VAASRGHLALLRQRRHFVAEGGEVLEAALARFEDVGPSLRAGRAEGDEVAAAAQAALDNLRSAPFEAAVEAEAGPTALFGIHQYATARVSAALGSVPVDAATGAPLGVKPAGSRK
jgi:hypothetical protein